MYHIGGRDASAGAPLLAPEPAAAPERKDFLSTLPAEEREFVEDVYAGCPTEELKHKYADFEGIRSRVREYYLAYHA